MKLTFISDTHFKHNELPAIESGDVLIHCGDFTGRGDIGETEEFADFIAAQDFTRKIVIAGNHDWCFEDGRRDGAEECLSDLGIIYLNDSGVEIDGISFWGSPIQPAFFSWAFNRERGSDIRAHWDLIPENTDVLLTHGPAFGILDRCVDGNQAGCSDLLRAIQRIKPKVHACGHIHEAYGRVEQDGTVFVNACNLDEYYQMAFAPILVEI